MPVPISPRIAAIAESATLAVSSKARALKAQGIDVVDFGVGEPDFDTPEHIKHAAVKALAAGKTKYTPSAGTPQLRAAIAEKLKKDNGLDYAPAQIIVSDGAKHSLFNTMLTLVRPGDEVLIPSPYWVTYPEQVRLAGGSPVFVPCSPEKGYRLDAGTLAPFIRKGKTRVLVLNSPSNPTGAVIEPQELKRIGELCLANDVSVISDEIYEKLIYCGRQHASVVALVPGLKETSVVINGLSKAYAMTGWRIGYAAAPAAVAAAMSRLQDQSTSNPNSIAQEASVAALTGDQTCVETMRREFDERRKLMLRLVREIPGLTAPEPEGAFYVFAGCAGLVGKTVAGVKIDGSMALAQVCLEKANVAFVPGLAFGDDHAFRLSYATGTDRITEGLRRIGELLATAK